MQFRVEEALPPVRSVSNLNMRMRWRPTFCLLGAILFGLLTYGSLQVNRMIHQDHYGRFFWWGSVRLDSDPLNKRPGTKPCAPITDEECVGEPQYIWVDPGWIERALTLSAFPAFLIGIPVVRGLSHMGVSELLSFMITMPLLILAWFYTVGWLLDRWQFKRSLHRTHSPAQ